MRNYFFLIIATICTLLQAQIQLKGNVKDTNNLAIPYCSIGIKDTEIGAITDENGHFSIEIPENGLDFNTAVDQFENALIIKALEKTGWNKNQAAILLRLNRTTLVEKMKKKGLKSTVESSEEIST